MTFGVNALDWTSVTQKMAETFRNEDATTDSSTEFEPDYLITNGETDATGTLVKLIASVDNDDISQWWQVENSAGETTFYWVIPGQADWFREEYQTYFSELPEEFTYSLTAKVYPADVELPIDTENYLLKEAEAALLSSTSLASVITSVTLDESLEALKNAYNDLLSGEQEEEEEEVEDETTTDDSTGGGLDGILDKLSSSLDTLTGDKAKNVGMKAAGVAGGLLVVGIFARFALGGKKKPKTLGEQLDIALGSGKELDN